MDPREPRSISREKSPAWWRSQDQQYSRTSSTGKRDGKAQDIAETGAGQHGVATAMAARLLGLKAEIYMGREDRRDRGQRLKNETARASVHPVHSGSKTAQDAINER